ncbi:signal peptide peptidase SppA [bacterium]|nr:signal peptide peptidase SppA [bacterium]
MKREKKKRKVGLVVGIVVGGIILLILLAEIIALSVFLARRTDLGAGNVAIIDIKGPIYTSKEIIEKIHKYKKNRTVKALVIRLETPGGGVAACQEIYEELNKVKEKKKVVASMGGVTASGGYYIACAADKIIANPGTVTGSIGVVMHISNLEELFKKVGLKFEVIKSGAHKDIGSPSRTMTPAERALLQRVINDVHNQFIEVIVRERGLDKGKVRSLADGRIFTGKQAKELGLVDELGNLDDAIKLAGELAEIKGEPKVIREKEKRKFTIFDLIRPRDKSDVSLEYIFE